MLYDLVVRLQKELNLKEPLGGPNDPTYSLALEDSVITIIDAPPGFTLSCNLGSLPNQQVEDFLALMLRGNLFGQTTRHSALGLDETGNFVLVQYHYPQRPTYKDLYNAIEDFINVIDFWKTQLKTHPAETTT